MCLFGEHYERESVAIHVNHINERTTRHVHCTTMQYCCTAPSVLYCMLGVLILWLFRAMFSGVGPFIWILSEYETGTCHQVYRNRHLGMFGHCFAIWIVFTWITLKLLIWYMYRYHNIRISHNIFISFYSFLSVIIN